MEENQTLQQFINEIEDVFKPGPADNILSLEGEHLSKFENKLLSLKEFEGVEKINFISSDEFNRDHQKMVEEKGEPEMIMEETENGYVVKPSHGLEQYVTVKVDDGYPLFNSKQINLYQITIDNQHEDENKWRILIRLKLSEEELSENK